MKNFGIVLAFVVVLGAAGFMACREDIAGTPRMVLLFIGPTVLCALGGAWLLWKVEQLRPLFTFRPGDFTRGFVIAALLFAGAFAATHFLFPFGSDRSRWLLRIYIQLGDPEKLKDQVPFVIGAIAVAAVAEETIFRGVIPYLLEEHVGTRRAWLYSAVIFGVAQIPTAWALRTKNGDLNPLLPVAALLCGLVWGQMTRRFGRLWPAIISHALFDWCVVMMFRLYGTGV